MEFKTIFSRRWFVTNLLVLAALLVLFRLGMWQLDRLEQRRVFNTRLFEQADAEMLYLTLENESEDLFNMEYRQISVTGNYDFPNQVALRNQYQNNQVGVHLITPLIISGSNNLAIMVDRGWIPQADVNPGNWDKYDEMGEVVVRGHIRRSQILPQLNMLPDPTLTVNQLGLDTWSQINLERIAEQIPYEILAVYVHQTPSEGLPELPTRTESALELDEGPHMGYALQWFTFAIILIIGYPFYIRNQEEKNEQK